MDRSREVLCRSLSLLTCITIVLADCRMRWLSENGLLNCCRVSASLTKRASLGVISFVLSFSTHQPERQRQRTSFPFATHDMDLRRNARSARLRLQPINRVALEAFVSYRGDPFSGPIKPAGHMHLIHELPPKGKGLIKNAVSRALLIHCSDF